MGENMVKTESTQVDDVMKYKDINGLEKIGREFMWDVTT